MAPQTSTKNYFAVLLLLSVVLLFPSLGKMPLWIYDEARNAECAREMWERHDWLVPTFNGELRTLKPPLHYFFMFGGFDLFGATEWGARFFSAVCGVLTILTVYYFVKKYSSNLHALLTSCVLLASTHFLFEFRMSVPDPYLILLNTISLFTAYAYFQHKKLFWLIICAVAFGLGALAKGPVAVALPGLALLCWLIWEKRWKEAFHWHVLAAAIIVLVIAVPWYIAVHKATDGAWTRGFFLEHNIGRFSEPMEGHGGIFIIVPLFILLGLLPASVFIGESLRDFRNRYQNSFLRLAFCVMVAFMAFYSVSGTKLPNYPMPCYPFVAILLGYFITLGFQQGTKTRMYPFIILLVINLALPVGLYFGIKNEIELQGYESHTFFLVLLTLAAIGSFIFYRKQGFRSAMLWMMGMYTLFNLIFFNYLYPALYRNNPLTKTLPIVKQYDEVIGYKIFQPSFTFYLPKRVRMFETPDSLQAYLQSHKALILSRQELTPELDSLHLKLVAAHHDLFENHTTVLLTNKP